MSKLSLKQQRITDEYISANIEYSTVKAGFSMSYVRGDAHKLMANVSIKAYTDERLEVLNSKKVADQKGVMQFITSVIHEEIIELAPVFVVDGFQEVMDLKPNVLARCTVQCCSRFW